MKLHRLRLKNFRGIAERECVFADRGVTVVSGRNEAGKSSMVEALDLLLDVPSASKSRRVTAVQPAGLDVGTEVEAEITCGDWHFTYAKVYNKGQSTSLRVHSPQPEQLTGKLAHERASAILAEAVDLALLRASRVVQGTAATAVPMSESASITRALDRAVADRDQDDVPADGADPDADLLAAVEEQYKRYYTVGRGQPTGELAQARQREQAARAQLAQLDAALEAVEADAETVGRLTRHRKKLGAAQDQAKIDLERAEDDSKAADAVRDRLAVVTAKSEAAGLRAAAAAKDLETRRKTATAISRLSERQAAFAMQHRTDGLAAERAMAEAEAIEKARAEAEAALVVARAALAAGEQVDEAIRLRRESTAAADRLRLAEQAVADSAEQEAALAANTVDAGVLARARGLHEELMHVDARLGAAAATVRVLKVGENLVRINGDELVGDSETEIAVVSDVVVDVPGVVRLEVRSGTDTAELAQSRASLAAQASDLAATHGVVDLAALLARGEQRRALAPQAAAARAEAARACGGQTLDELRETAARLRSRVAELPPTPSEVPDLPALREAERAASTAHLAAERAGAAHARTLAECRAAADRAAAEADRAAHDLAELVTARDEARQTKSDEDLGAELEAADAEMAAIGSSVQQLRAELEAADAAGVERRLEKLEAALASLADERARGEREIAQALARIDLYREDSRRDRRDEAAAAHASAIAELERVTARAEAASLLRSTLTRHRSSAHARYSEPFRRHVEDLAKPLFGPEVRFTVDEELGITARTLDGATVGFEELSMGAREQIGIIARLACAMLVDEAEGVPVIIDDALGHSDSDRVAQMAQVLTRAGEHAQVIVLTCAPERYEQVQTAASVAI